MKKTPLLYVTLGFIAGIFYIAACSGGNGLSPSASIAETIGSAVDILFNNSDSGLTATNVQTALDEIDGRVDALEKNDLKSLLVGSWTGKQRRTSRGLGGEEINTVSLTINADGTYSCSIEASPADAASSSKTNFALQNNKFICDSGCRLWQLFGSTLELHYVWDSSGACSLYQSSNSEWVFLPIQILDGSTLQLGPMESGRTSEGGGVIVVQRQ